ncbi:hypothetical protein [Algoriphagus namhaensis]
MRQLEIMNRKVKNVSRFNLHIVVLFLSFLLPQYCFSQNGFGFDEEKYDVVSSAWPNAKEKTIKLSRKTLGYESWMDEVWGKEFASSKGVGFCDFEENHKLAKAFEDLRVSVKNLTVKKLSRKLVDERFDLKRPSGNNNLLTLSEPIIIGDYAFLFFSSKKDSGLYVQKKNSAGNWDPHCGVTIYGQLY